MLPLQSFLPLFLINSSFLDFHFLNTLFPNISILPLFQDITLVLFLFSFVSVLYYLIFLFSSSEDISFSSSPSSHSEDQEGRTKKGKEKGDIGSSFNSSDPGKGSSKNPSDPGKSGTIGNSTTTGITTFIASLVTKAGFKKAGTAGFFAKLGHEAIDSYNRNPEAFNTLITSTGKDLGRSFSEHMHGSKDDLVKTLGQHSKENLPNVNSDISTSSSKITSPLEESYTKMTSPLEQSYPITDGSIFQHDI
jgi:hypothetical protein